jgi:hypothetical protein
MKSPIFLISFFLMLSLQISRADLSIVQQIEDFQLSPSTTEQIKIFASGNRMRIDQGQKLSSIILKEKKVTYSIMHESQQYVVLIHETASIPVTVDPIDDYTIENTGKTEQVHGFACKQLRIKEKSGDVSELWLSDKALDVNLFYREFVDFMELGLGPVTKQLDKHPELKGIPIRVTEFHNEKKLKESTLMHIDTKKILDSLFEVPAGYSELKMNSSDSR